MITSDSPAPRPEDRHDRLLKELMHDPYHTKKKLAEPTLCPECGAVYQEGRWRWGEARTGAHQELCPACHRINDHCPAGFLNIGGAFLEEHRDEIQHVIHNVEQREKAAHPLKRLMAVEDRPDGSLLATFTDPQLARAVGEALHDAYKGNLDFAYQDSEFMLRVTWSR